VAYGLKLAQTPKKQLDEKTDRILSLVHLGGFEDRMPQALSGGQAQRVALARALVMEPTVLLMDECLSALDLQLRKAMQDELRSIHAALGGTYVFVTHDQNEAMSLATRIAVMKDGKIVQQGSAKDIYENPANEFVAGFVGEANMIKGRRTGERIHVPDLQCAVTSYGGDCNVTVVVRPDVIEFASPEQQYDFAMLGTVQSKTYFGSHLSYDVDLGHGRAVKLTKTLNPTGNTPEVGQQMRVGWNADQCKILEVE
jgi:ABC-type Fe3+/spermidine/putrescine transport system ATPase subunit